MVVLKHLGYILTPTDDDGSAVVANLRKSRKKWSRMSRIPSWDGEMHVHPGMF